MAVTPGALISKATTGRRPSSAARWLVAVCAAGVVVALGAGVNPYLAAERGYPVAFAATTDPNWPARRWRIGPANASACIHPTRRAVAQRLHRVVQRPHPRRMPQHNLFWSLAHARVVIADWNDDDNHRRRHSALCYQPPAVCAASCTHR